MAIPLCDSLPWKRQPTRRANGSLPSPAATPTSYPKPLTTRPTGRRSTTAAVDGAEVKHGGSERPAICRANSDRSVQPRGLTPRGRRRDELRLPLLARRRTADGAALAGDAAATVHPHTAPGREPGPGGRGGPRRAAVRATLPRARHVRRARAVRARPAPQGIALRAVVAGRRGLHRRPQRRLADNASGRPRIGPRSAGAARGSAGDGGTPRRDHSLRRSQPAGRRFSVCQPR